MEQLRAFLEGFSWSSPAMSSLGSTVILLVVLIVFHSVVGRFLRRHITSSELRRKWLVQSRNGLVLLFLIGFVMIWGEELRTLALSIVAIAVAFVVATKELILCVTGTLLKTGAGSFDIGDRIQVKDFRGDVIDQNLLATTILEVGPGKLTHQRTGRMTVIPNALFVSEAVINESFTQEYVLHVFTVPFKREDNWEAARTAFEEAARRHCEPFLSQARRHMVRFSRQRGLDAPPVEPRVSLQVPTAGEMHLIIRLPVRARERNTLEQAILMEVFANNDFSASSKKPVEDQAGQDGDAV